MPWETLRARHHANAVDDARLRIACHSGTVNLLLSDALARQLGWAVRDAIAIQRGTEEQAGLWRLFKPGADYRDSRWRLQYSGKSSRSLKLVLRPAAILPDDQAPFDCAVQRDGENAVIIAIPWLTPNPARRIGRDVAPCPTVDPDAGAAPKAAERVPQPIADPKPAEAHDPEAKPARETRADVPSGEAEAGPSAPAAARSPGPEGRNRANPDRDAGGAGRSPAPAPKLYRPSDTIQRPTRERLMAGR